jgi:hypothetical protein
MDIRKVPFPITVREVISSLWGILALTMRILDTVKPNGLSSYLNLINQRAKIEGYVV